MLVVGLCLATPRLSAFVPWAVGAMIGFGHSALRHEHRRQRQSGATVLDPRSYRVRPGFFGYIFWRHSSAPKLPYGSARQFGAGAPS